MTGAPTTIRLPTQRELIQQKYVAPEQSCQLSDYAAKISKEGKLDAAIVAIRRALALAPDHPVLLSHLGAFLWDAGQYAEAEAALRRSIAIEPEYAPSRGNLASVLGALAKYDEADAMSRVALKLEPDWVDARWNYAMMLLDSGRWAQAWNYYDARIERGDRRIYPVLPYPIWKGESLHGKTLWVQGEQGVGDRILFARYLHWVKSEFPDCRILYQMDAVDLPNINNLMWAYRDIVEFVPNGTPWAKDVDYGIYLMSLPKFHASTPDHVPLEPGLILSQTLRQKGSVNLPEPLEPSLKVGIVWSGSAGMKRNIERSVPIELMMRLAELPNVVLYSMQFDSNDLYAHGGDGFIKDLAPSIQPLGFSGTAMVMLNLDLVITACTATAHLAGALNVPCWTLLCANPYWVWLRGRGDSVWYPRTRLFRQSTMYDWGSVYDQVRPELEQVAAQAASQQRAA